MFIVLLFFIKFDWEMVEICNWNEKVEKLVEMVLQWDISMIVGILSWCIMFMEKIVECYGKNNIYDIWFNLDLYMLGGVYIELYLLCFNKVIGWLIYVMNMYLVSEGYIVY